MRIFTLLFLCFILMQLHAQKAFDEYFESKTMRVDFYLAGNDSSEQIFFNQIKEEVFWGGSKKNLTDTFNYGVYRFFVYDSLSNTLIYSRGFCSLFQEWQYTKEAESHNKIFYETIVFPYPKKTVRLEVQKRNKDNSFSQLLQMHIDPDDYFIKKDQPVYGTDRIKYNGDPANHVDIVFLPDGYTEAEMTKFRLDVKKFAGYLYSTEPFKAYKKKINVWAVMAISKESGTDIPGKDIWKNTVLNTNFYTFDSERYLTTLDIASVRDLAAHVPYDQIYVIVNTNKYGGGGVYNYYSLCSSDNIFSEKVFLHEFGHGFAGLADEYYTSEVSVEDYYDLKSEPWEPNITTMVDLKSKWKSMIENEIPVPTPAIEKYLKSVGVYEGAGYSEKDVFRPYQDCMMKSLDAPEGFCPVCKRAIIDMINFYSE